MIWPIPLLVGRDGETAKSLRIIGILLVTPARLVHLSIPIGEAPLSVKSCGYVVVPPHHASARILANMPALLAEEAGLYDLTKRSRESTRNSQVPSQI